MKNTTSLTVRLLVALLDFSQSNQRSSVQELSEFLGCSRSRTACALNHLIEGNLISSQSHCLTFIGLTLATQLRAEQRLQSAPPQAKPASNEGQAA